MSHFTVSPPFSGEKKNLVVCHFQSVVLLFLYSQGLASAGHVMAVWLMFAKPIRKETLRGKLQSHLENGFSAGWDLGSTQTPTLGVGSLLCLKAWGGIVSMGFWWEVMCELGFEECIGVFKNGKVRKGTLKRNIIFGKSLKCSWRKIV